MHYQNIITKLKIEFDVMENDGQYFIGLEIKRDRARKRLFIGQSNYLKCIIKRFNLTNAKHMIISAENLTFTCQQK